MRRRVIGFWLAAACMAVAQTPEVRSKASDYPLHTSSPDGAIGAEYLARSVPSPMGSYYAENYLVVEVALFPSAPGLMISSGHFTLRVNGKKAVLFAQTPGMVASDIKFPDNESTNPDGIFGGPVTARFPGDPTTPRPRAPPAQTHDGGIDPTQPLSVDDAVKRAALPEGKTDKPVRGCLFFPFHGKTKSIKSLELVYESAAGEKTALPLF